MAWSRVSRRFCGSEPVRSNLLVASLLVIPCAAGQAQVDPRGDWRTWHTPHFRIHARTEHGGIIAVASAEAERAYSALSGELRPPRGTIDMVLYDNVDFSNGSATTFPSNRITLFLTPPAGELGLGRYDEWLRLVITHEVTHIFHLDRADGVWGVAQHVFGRAPPLFPNYYRPGWVLEGLAAHYESRLTGGGRGRGAFHTQLLVSAAGADRWPAPGDVNFSNSGWPGGLGPYAFGSRFFDWEAETRGDSVVSRFIDHTSRRVWPFAISGPLKQAGGEGLAKDWRNFRKSWEGQARAGTPSSIIARGLRYEPRPRVSRDDSLLAYIKADGRSPERVVIRDLSSSRDLASHRVNGSPEFTWIGHALILAQLDFTTPVEIRNRLYRWRPGGSFEAATPVSRLTRPFAMAGSVVGAVRIGPAQTTVIRLRGDSVESLPVPGGDTWAHLAESPDGKYMAGSRHANGQWDIVLWPAGSPAEVRAVTDDAALDDEPSWSDDGATLIFTSERTGLPQIYAYQVATGSLVQMTDEPTGGREGNLAAGTLYFSTVLGDGYAVMSRPGTPVESGGLERSAPPVVLAPEPVAARQSRYSSWGSLAPTYWLPLVHVIRPTGVFLGAATSGSDVVGRTAYVAGLAVTATKARWEGFLALAHTRWSNLSLDASAVQTWDRGPAVLLPPAVGPVTLVERDRSITVGGTVLRQRWRSQISARVGAEVTQDAFFAPDSFPACCLNPAFLGGVASGAAGYTHRQALSISDEDGVLINALYRRRWVVSGPGWSDEVRAVARGYLGVPLPGFAHWVLAGRVAGAVSGGPNAKRFALGGESGSRLAAVPGVGFGNGTRDFGLRGYPPGASLYTRAVASVAELRIPLFLMGKGVWRLPLSVDRMSVSFFGEAGGGWQGSGPRRIAQYQDAGAELLLDLGLNLDVPIRLRVGAAQALTTGLGANKGEWRGYVAVGSAF